MVSVIAIEKLSIHSLKQKAVQYTLSTDSHIHLLCIYLPRFKMPMTPHLSPLRCQVSEPIRTVCFKMSRFIQSPDPSSVHISIFYYLKWISLWISVLWQEKSFTPREREDWVARWFFYQVSSWANPFLPVLFWGRLFCCCLVEFWWLNLGPHACWANVLPLRAISQALIKFSFVCLKLWINFHQIAQAGI